MWHFDGRIWKIVFLINRNVVGFFLNLPLRKIDFHATNCKQAEGKNHKNNKVTIEKRDSNKQIKLSML